MKLTIKTFRQETFEIVIEPEKTIYDLKCYLQQFTKNQYPADQITLIYCGFILDDDRQISSYKINESKFLVVLMKWRTQLEPSKKTKPPASKNFTNIRTEAQNNPRTAMSCNTVSLQTETQASDDRFRSTERLINTELINKSIQNIVDALGYPEDEVRHAFSASFNNPDLTVDFLINGIPSSELVRIGLDLGAIEKSISEEWHDFVAVTTAAVTAATESTTPQTSPIQFLRTDPRFQRMRIALRRNPDLFEHVINRIADTQIGLFNLIRENQQEFVNMINEPFDDSSDDDDDQNSNHNNNNNNHHQSDNGGYDYEIEGDRFVQDVAVTPEDEQAIKRLMDLGFSDYLCVEAYFVCDKDEERAANFLFSHSENPLE